MFVPSANTTTTRSYAQFLGCQENHGEEFNQFRWPKHGSSTVTLRKVRWIGAVAEIRSIVDRFPQHELEIRRRCARDECFRSVCKDYEEAAKALRYWQQAGRDGERMAEEYTNFLGELEAEILARLDCRVSNVRRS